MSGREVKESLERKEWEMIDESILTRWYEEEEWDDGGELWRAREEMRMFRIGMNCSRSIGYDYKTREKESSVSSNKKQQQYYSEHDKNITFLLLDLLS